MRPLWDLSGARAAPYTTQKLNLLTGGADKLFRGSVAGRCGRRYWAIKSWLPACYWARWHGDERRFFLAPFRRFTSIATSVSCSPSLFLLDSFFWGGGYPCIEGYCFFFFLLFYVFLFWWHIWVSCLIRDKDIRSSMMFNWNSYLIFF